MITEQIATLASLAICQSMALAVACALIRQNMLIED
jgi:hypothetical protein